MDADLSFGHWLQLRRKTLDLTQGELAQRVGYARVTIHKIETDALRPSRQMVEKLVDELAIAPNERQAFMRFARDDSRADLSLVPLPERVPVPRFLPRHHNLPVLLTRFIGREKEVQDGCALLRRDVRLLTLTGAGGMGKTRLSLEVAAAMVETFPDGVWFVDLAPLEDPDLIGAAIATVLGVRGNPSQPLQTVLVAALRGRHLLLLLDNCEHVIDACAQLIEQILHAAPAVRILATSRQALRIAGEVCRTGASAGLAAQYCRHSRPTPALRGCAPIRGAGPRRSATFRRDDSERQGAGSNLPAAGWNAAGAGASGGARSRVDCGPDCGSAPRSIPVADRREPEALPRQQTLRATIDWSYDLLSRRDRLLFERLAVFAGGWTLEAADAVCAGDEIDCAEVLDGLTALIDQSLVVVAEHGAERRYGLLETLRQYAWERLLESGQASDAQERHLTWCLQLAEQADPERPGTDRTPRADATGIRARQPARRHGVESRE